MKKRRSGLLNTVAMFIPLALVATVFVFSSQTTTIQNAAQETPACQEIHWHALLRIEVNSETQFIPANIGIGSEDQVIDTVLSGTAASPMHTHDASGVIHIENKCPERNPETMKLGYFFKVWQKNFNSTCVLDKCNDGEKIVQMAVNGGESLEFEHYRLQDGDAVLITYGKPKEVVIQRSTLSPLSARRIR